MKYFSAQYIFTNAGPPIKRGIICAEDDGTIISVEDSGGSLTERHSVEFFNGIIIPGFVNCHCHLELSHLKNKIPASFGLAAFLTALNSIRNTLQKDITRAIKKADNEMVNEGIVLCADICNTPSTFTVKKASRIRYFSLLEIFGIDPSRAEIRINEILGLSKKASEINLPHWIVPHAVYSISLPLFRLIKKNTALNKISSIHFMESAEEETLLKSHSGPLMDSFTKFLHSVSDLNIADNHIKAITEEITSSGNLILVHNTFVRQDHIKRLKNRKDIYWCLCPNSNLRIEQRMPPVDLLVREGCNIVVGTDSLASNSSLSIVEELKTIQKHFPTISLEKLISWATINGAKALGESVNTGTIEPGKKPGLVLLKNVDLANLKLFPDTTVKRLL
jgi:cytosine/adenosine deaminase-related metal-dependent hydrolase